MNKSNTPQSMSIPKRTLLLLAVVALILGILAIRHCAGLNAQYVDPMITVNQTQAK